MMVQTPKHGVHTPPERRGGDLPTFASLPAEIVRLILEHLGRHSGGEAASLLCVSKLVHAWILPVLYETILLKHATDLLQIQRILTSHPEIAPYVHNVCLQLEGYAPGGEDAALAGGITSLFSRCQHIRSVYLNNTFMALHYNAAQLPHLEDLHCGSWGSWLTHDILGTFHPLTHLRVDLVHNTGVHASLVPLLRPPPHALQHLTHLAFGADGRATLSERRATKQFLRDVLAARPRLMMLVVMVWFCWDPEYETIFGDIADPRLCVLTTGSRLDGASSLAEWEDAVRGRQSIWRKAEAIMEQRKAHSEHSIAI